MTILFRLDNPNQFTVLIDGRERAKIRRAAENWTLYRTDDGRFTQVDVTRVINDQNALSIYVRSLLRLDAA